MRPDEATNALAIFEGKIMRLKEERENVAKAKEALELAEPGKKTLGSLNGSGWGRQGAWNGVSELRV